MDKKNKEREGYAKYRKCIYKCVGVDKKSGENIVKFSEETDQVVAHPTKSVEKWNKAATEQAKPGNRGNQLFYWVAVEKKEESKKDAPKDEQKK